MLHLVSVRPVIRVSDVLRSLSWYRDNLGFTPEAEPAEPPHVRCVLQRDGVSLMLRHADAVPPRSLLPGDWDVYLTLEGEALAELLDHARRRTPLVRGPEVMPGGMVEFELEDPDGYRVCVAERLSDVTGFPPAVG